MNICGITQKERGNVLNIKLPFIDYFPAIILHFFWGFLLPPLITGEMSTWNQTWKFNHQTWWGYNGDIIGIL